MEKQDKNVEAYQLGAYVMQRMGINEGIMFRYHQKYFKEQNCKRKCIFSTQWLLLSMICCMVIKRYLEAKIRISRKILRWAFFQYIRSCCIQDDTMWLYGSNFNEFSIVIINGKQYEPTSQHQNLIKIEDLKLGGSLEVCVAQQDDYGKTILSTTRSCRVEVNH